ncbi:glucan biosynthesis protein [Alkalidesulfovibrio alkalitolerans]|nr:glucan biosynthesis protein G [Alkalidesulfovibrio alkalitolerans]
MIMSIRAVERFGRFRRMGRILLLCLAFCLLALPAKTAKEAGGNGARPAQPRPAESAAKPRMAEESAETFGFEQVAAMAEALSKAPHEPPVPGVPSFLLQGNQYWDAIRYKAEKALWHGEKLPHTLQFFHPGGRYDRAVAVHVIEDGRVSPVPFSRELFDYGALPRQDEIPGDLGFAGFRAHAPINSSTVMDEYLVFLGATYFRSVGKGQFYGSSARGLAIDTAQPRGEEFPWFSKFWVVKPKPKDRQLTVHALMDSPSVTGAFTFTSQPGLPTVVEVKSVLFPRRPVDKLGIAPLNSMFLMGENSTGRRFEDYRPEVHDADGLLVALQNGEWIWRPLQNPRTLQINSFAAPGLKGFGLMQRDRDFASYQDLSLRQELRPSIWVEPLGEWGEGRVELVQIPTDNENNDNITAFWTPAVQPTPGEPLRFAYRVYWGGPFKDIPPDGYVTATRVGRDLDGKTRVFVLDFDGQKLRELASDSPPQAVVTVGAGATLVGQRIEKNPVTGAWRLTFRILPDDPSGLHVVLDKRPPIEMRVFLRDLVNTLTETWSYSYRL